MNDAFLIDECLSPQLVGYAHLRGFLATHVVHRALNGTLDRDLMPIIIQESFVLVTSNRRDFLALYRREEIHPGLIIIVPGNIEAREQIRLFSIVLDYIGDTSDLSNLLIEVQGNGEVSILPLP